MATAAVAAIGHNHPPSIKEQALIEAGAALKPLLDRADELTSSAEKARADDADSAAKCADLVRMIRSCDTALTEKRKEVQAPYKAAVDVIMDLPRSRHTALSRAKRDLGDLITAWDRKERIRLKAEAEEEAAQVAAEQEALAARAAEMGVDLPAEDAVPLPVRKKPVSSVDSDLGCKVHTRKVTTYTVTDPYALPPEVLNHEKVIAAIVSVVREMHRGVPERKIKGILIGEEETAVVR